MQSANDTRRTVVALAVMALIGVALVFLFPGSPEQDTSYHFLMNLAAWHNPYHFVGVWERPLYTLVYAFPALIGFNAGRFFAVFVGVLTAWQAWRLALDLKLERAWLAIPLLLAQPVFFELYSDMLTEPFFGLLFVIALRCHLHGRVKTGMLLAAFLPLARPEGFFLGILWGVWILARAVAANPGRPVVTTILRAIPSTLILATGVFAWWLAAFCLSGDPLYIPHSWPHEWHQGMYGQGGIFGYAYRAVEFTGVFLLIPFLIGLWQTLPRRAWMPVTTSFLLLFVLHSIFRKYGLFGEAGYPRYMVSVGAATAVITLQGWNALASRITAGKNIRVALGWGVLAFSLFHAFVYLDCLFWARGAVGIKETAQWFRENPQPYTRLIWSDARMGIELGKNIDNSSAPSGKGEDAAKLFRDATPGTLVFWDDHLGPEWFGMTSPEIEKCGYKIIRTKRYTLPGVTGLDGFLRKAPPFEIEVTLLMKQ